MLWTAPGRGGRRAGCEPVRRASLVNQGRLTVLVNAALEPPFVVLVDEAKDIDNVEVPLVGEVAEVDRLLQGEIVQDVDVARIFELHKVNIPPATQSFPIGKFEGSLRLDVSNGD